VAGNNKGKEKKRSGLGANPLDWIKDTSEVPEAKAPEQKAPPKRKPRTRKLKVQKVESENVQEVETPEVQDLKTSIVEKEISLEVQDDEMLELSETIVQEGVELSASDVFLESDPLFRQYKEAQTHVPKYQQLDVKLYVLLRDDQLEFLARLTREIMKNRTSEYKTERITKNTILRALIDNLKELELDVRNIQDEAELAKRIAEAISAK
jgi:hypothetical protein